MRMGEGRGGEEGGCRNTVCVTVCVCVCLCLFFCIRVCSSMMRSECLSWHPYYTETLNASVFACFTLLIAPHNCIHLYSIILRRSLCILAAAFHDDQGVSLPRQREFFHSDHRTCVSLSPIMPCGGVCGGGRRLSLPGS